MTEEYDQRMMMATIVAGSLLVVIALGFIYYVWSLPTVEPQCINPATRVIVPCPGALRFPPLPVNDTALRIADLMGDS